MTDMCTLHAYTRTPLAWLPFNHGEPGNHKTYGIVVLYTKSFCTSFFSFLISLFSFFPLYFFYCVVSGWSSARVTDYCPRFGSFRWSSSSANGCVYSFFFSGRDHAILSKRQNSGRRYLATRRKRWKIRREIKIRSLAPI